MSLFPGPIRVTVRKPREEGNRCELAVEDAQNAPNTATGGICGAGSAPTCGVLWVVEF